MNKLPLIEIDYQVFLADGADEIGAVRYVAPNGQPEIVIYVENSGDFTVPLTAVASVHSRKVILNQELLSPALLKADVDVVMVGNCEMIGYIKDFYLIPALSPTPRSSTRSPPARSSRDGPGGSEFRI